MQSTSGLIYGSNSLDEKIKNSLSRTNHVFNNLYSRSMPDLTKTGTSSSDISASKAVARKSSLSGKSEILESETSESNPAHSFLPPINLTKFDKTKGIDLSAPNNTEFFISPHSSAYKNAAGVQKVDTKNTETMEMSVGSISGDVPNKMFDSGKGNSTVGGTFNAASGPNVDINNRLAELKKKMDDVANQLKPSNGGKFSALEEYKRQQMQLKNDSSSEHNYNRVKALAANRFSSAVPFRTYESNTSRPDTFDFNPLPKSVQEAYNSDQSAGQKNDEYQSHLKFQKPEPVELKVNLSSPKPAYELKYGVPLEEITNMTGKESQSHGSNSLPTESENSGSVTEDNDDVSNNSAYPSHKPPGYFYNNKTNKSKIKKKFPVNGTAKPKSPILLNGGSSYANLAMKQSDYKKKQVHRKIRKIKTPSSINGSYLIDGAEDRNLYLDVNNYLDSVHLNKETNPYVATPPLYPRTMQATSLYGKNKVLKSSDGSLYKDSPNAKRYFENLQNGSNPATVLLYNYPSSSVYLEPSLYQSQVGLYEKNGLQSTKTNSVSSQIFSNSSGYDSDGETRLNGGFDSRFLEKPNYDKSNISGILQHNKVFIIYLKLPIF